MNVDNIKNGYFSVMKILFVCISLCGYSVAALAIGQEINASKDLKIKWGGLWKNVEHISSVMPEEEPFRAVGVYDLLSITKVSGKGFSYRNAGNDVGYGPNEQTYYQGEALYTEDGNAVDEKNNLAFVFIQGEKVWDRGITLSVKGKNEKYFKQKRTVFDAGFDCEKAGTLIENKICTTAILARADKEMGALYRHLRKTLSQTGRTELRKKQRLWVKARNRQCQDKVHADLYCLSGYYSSRLLALRKLSDPKLKNATDLIDAEYILSVYQKNSEIWSDTVFRLYMISRKKEELLREWKKYKPEIKFSGSNIQVEFTGAYQYETIIWPNDVLVKNNFQIVVDEKPRIWISVSKDTGSGAVVTIDGPEPYAKAVLQWASDKKIKTE